MNNQNETLRRLSPELVGHKDAQARFAAAVNSDRMHHAWLLNGPEGVGKARFAAQAAAYCVAESARQSEVSLELDLEHPQARLIHQGAHPDVIWIDKSTGHERKTPPKVIPVSGVRSSLQKMQSTAAYGGWRVVVVDAVDDLNAEGANALLKPLEEPPRRTVVLLVCHALHRALPTIRSRCQMLSFHPLHDDDLAKLVEGSKSTEEKQHKDSGVGLAVALAEGRAGRALRLIEDPDILELFVQFQALAVSGDTPSLKDRLTMAHAANGLAADRQSLFFGLIDDWLARRTRGALEPGSVQMPMPTLNAHQRAAIADLWSDLTSGLALRQAINLDVSETLMTLFARLDAVYSEAQRVPSS
ncbi:MAG: DNA polymerase III subunit delta' [Pseudomonadota bacterium]